MKTFSETQRYAKAVYRLAYEAKNLDILEKDFLKLKEILDQSSDLKKFIKNPTHKYSVINNVIDALSKHFTFSDLFSRFLKDWLKTIKIKKNISLTVDVDPINFK